MILIDSNVSNFFKKQHSSTLYCLAKRRSLDGNNNSMDGEVFSNKNRSYNIYWEIVPLTTIDGQSKEWVNINRGYFLKSCKKGFNCLIISLGSKSSFNWSNTLHLFKKIKD